MNPKNLASLWEIVGEGFFGEPIVGWECRCVSMFDFLNSSIVVAIIVQTKYKEKTGDSRNTNRTSQKDATRPMKAAKSLTKLKGENPKKGDTQYNGKHMEMCTPLPAPTTD